LGGIVAVITHIVFDLGNVLIPFNLAKAVMGLISVCNKPQDEVIQFFTKSEYDKKYVEGKITSEEFFEAAKDELAMSVSFEEFADKYSAIFDHNEEMEKFVQEIGSRYTLAILSNTNEIHFEYILKNYPIMQEFDEYILSYEENCQKPQYSIYQRLISRLGVPPQKVLFIDDLEANVITAQQLGIRAIHYTDMVSLKMKMQKYGVKI